MSSQTQCWHSHLSFSFSHFYVLSSPFPPSNNEPHLTLFNHAYPVCTHMQQTSPLLPSFISCLLHACLSLPTCLQCSCQLGRMKVSSDNRKKLFVPGPVWDNFAVVAEGETDLKCTAKTCTWTTKGGLLSPDLLLLGATSPSMYM